MGDIRRGERSRIELPSKASHRKEMSASGERSSTLVLLRDSDAPWESPASGTMSETALPSRYRFRKDRRFPIGIRSATALSLRKRCPRSVACSRPVKSSMPNPQVVSSSTPSSGSLRKSAMSPRVIGSPSSFPSSSSNARRSTASGMSTRASGSLGSAVPKTPDIMSRDVATASANPLPSWLATTAESACERLGLRAAIVLRVRFRCRTASAGPAAPSLSLNLDTPSGTPSMGS